jgi:hypothetical protein
VVKTPKARSPRMAAGIDRTSETEKLFAVISTA